MKYDGDECFMIQADVREVKDALASAMKIMEAIALHVQSFIPKVHKLELSIK